MIGIGTIAKIGLSKVKGAVSWITDPKNRTIVLFAVIIAAGAYMFYQHTQISNLEHQQDISLSNIAALSSELVTAADSLGNVTSERGALQGDVDQLRTMNSDLAETVDSLKNNPEIITVTKTVVERDTIYDIDTIAEYLGQSRFRFVWSSEESGEWGFREIGGQNTFTMVNDTTVADVQTDITTDRMEMTITTGFRKTDEGFLRVFATTSFPGVQELDVQGALIDPRDYVSSSETKKRWGLGFQAGYGVNHKFEAYPFIGFGVSYNLFNW